MSATRSRPRRPARGRSLTRVQVGGLVAAAAGFGLPWVVDLPGLDPAGHRMLAVFLLAIVLWVTEAIPLHATASLIILAQIALVSDAAVLPLPVGYDPPPFAVFYEALANPVLMLFLGGFFLAEGAARFALDRSLARVLLRPFGSRPAMIMLGLMLITAVLSMFMSNTATTATMMAVLLPVLTTMPAADRMRTGMALSIPIASNVGGIGTPVGTPPNAIALGAMTEAGFAITFLEWMILTIPFVLVVLGLAWMVLARAYRSALPRLALSIDARFDRSPQARVFYATFAATVGLWLTEPLHGVPSTVVGFLPVVVLLSTRVFGADELRGVRWDVLWLVAGGIALATGVAATGLDLWMIGLVGWEALPLTLLLVLLVGIALLLSTVISNSATANLLVPIGLTLAVSEGVALAPVLAGVLIAVGCSLAMALPVSTPPNAIAYATGMVRTRDLALIGAVVGLVGALLFAFVAPWVWDATGLLAR